MLVAHEAAVEPCVNVDRGAALRSLAFEPTVYDLYVIGDLLDDLLTVNAPYLPPDFVARMKRRDPARRVELVETAPDNPMRPDASLPPGIPVLHSWWGLSGFLRTYPGAGPWFFEADRATASYRMSVV